MGRLRHTKAVCCMADDDMSVSEIDSIVDSSSIVLDVAEETASAGEEEMPAQEGASTPEPSSSESGRGMKRKSEDIQSTANNEDNASKAATGKEDAREIRKQW